MKKLMIILSVFILFGCSSTTIIKSVPNGAKVMKDGEIVGFTPYEIWDREASGYVAKYTLCKEGYKDKEITIEKDVLYIHRLFLPPLLALPWVLGYNPSYYFTLEKALKNDGLSLTIQDSTHSSSMANKPPSSENTQKLLDLKKLKDEGILTDEEYEEKRKVCLDNL